MFVNYKHSVILKCGHYYDMAQGADICDQLLSQKRNNTDVLFCSYLRLWTQQVLQEGSVSVYGD